MNDGITAPAMIIISDEESTKIDTKTYVIVCASSPPMPSSLAAELLTTSTSQSSSEEEMKEGMVAFAGLEPSMESLVWALGTSLE